jgi:hypothetical protein
MYKTLTPWIDDYDDGCAYRLLKGKEDKPCYRMAFIEKTPRIKLPANTYAVSIDETDIGATTAKVNAWVSGRKGSGPDDEESREWCDSMLRLLGYTLE